MGFRKSRQEREHHFEHTSDSSSRLCRSSTPGPSCSMAGKKAPVETRSFNIILLGGTGAGKSTLVNTMVNFFRGAPELFKRLPAVAELKVAVPTAFLGVTEDEGKKAKELNVKDRKTQRQTVWRNCLAFAKTMLLQPRLPSSESDLAELRISLSVNRKFLWHQSLFCISKSCLKMPVAAVCDDHMDA